jgi:PilZ domain
MSATNHARVAENLSTRCSADASKSAASAAPSSARQAQPTLVPSTGSSLSVPATANIPSLRVLPLLTDTHTRRFVRVPTHAVGVHPEHRSYPRATLRLPLRLRSVNNVPEQFPITLVTRDISSTGVYFLCPKALTLGTEIELEIILVSRPMGRGNVVAASMARVQRIETAAMPGWYGVAATFDELAFDRDDRVPSRFLKP